MPARRAASDVEWAIAALDRGDQVAATARDVASLDDLAARYGDVILPLGLDVTDRDAGVAAVKLAADYFGRLDVTVYDAGCGQFGMVEAPPRAGLTGVVAASRNRSSSASRAREWPLAAMTAVRLAGNG